jgi:hypothetical protein
VTRGDGVVLAAGKSFGFRDRIREDRVLDRVSYAIFSPGMNAWSGLKLFALPEQDHEGRAFLEPNSDGCQRFDLPGGDALLPTLPQRPLEPRLHHHRRPLHLR